MPLPLLHKITDRARTQLGQSQLDSDECAAWLAWALTQPNYYISTAGDAVCVTKVFHQIDPPWYCMAHEVLWIGSGRDAVRALHRGMDWARLRGAVKYGYSLAPHLDITKWKQL